MPQKYLGNMSCCNIMSWECQNVKVEEERERLSQRNVSTARAASCQYLLQTTHYSLPLPNRPISGNWKYTVEKSKTNATNVKHFQYIPQTTHYSHYSHYSCKLFLLHDIFFISLKCPFDDPLPLGERYFPGILNSPLLENPASHWTPNHLRVLPGWRTSLSQLVIIRLQQKVHTYPGVLKSCIFLSTGLWYLSVLLIISVKVKVYKT